MSNRKSDIPDLAIPVNVLLLVWMIVGRGLFVPLGWMMVLGVFAAPILVICLGISTAMLRRTPGRQLTVAQVRAQIVVWSAMFGFGLTCVDGGDGGSFDSVLTKLAGGGPTMQAISGVLWWGCCLVGLVAWVVLVWLLSARPAIAHTPRRPFLDPGVDPLP